MKILCALLALLAFAGCFPQAKNPVLVSNVSSFYLDDTEKQAKDAGVDYRPTVSKALNRDRKSLHTLFRLTGANVFDGSGAESHSAVLWCLLEAWGDKRFHEVLAAEDAQTRSQVITYIDFAAPSDYRNQYPLTYELARHSVRFGG